MTQTNKPTEILERLYAISLEISELEDQLTSRRQERDRLILEAIDNGATYRQASDAAGVTSSWPQQLKQKRAGD